MAIVTPNIPFGPMAPTGPADLLRSLVGMHREAVREAQLESIASAVKVAMRAAQEIEEVMQTNPEAAPIIRVVLQARLGLGGRTTGERRQTQQQQQQQPPLTFPNMPLLAGMMPPGPIPGGPIPPLGLLGLGR